MISLATVDKLGELLSDMVEDYVEKIIPKLDEELNSTADEIITYIKSNAPRSGNRHAFADTFTKVESGSGMNKTVSIYSEGKGGLTHLLEFGYTHRSGKYIGPKPFLRPAYDIFTPKMLEAIKDIITKGD